MIGRASSLLARTVAVLAVVAVGVVVLAPRVSAASDPAGTPVGHVDAVAAVPGGVYLRGWAIDPDRTGPIYVWVTVDGNGRHLLANEARPDVGAAYPDFGADHGFSGTLPVPAGTHTVCVAASNVGQGVHKPLGCWALSVRAGSPFGNYEEVGGGVGAITVRGWAIDPDTTVPIYVWVTIDGAGRHLYANTSRPDVAGAYPGYGPNHGFTGTLTATAGVHTVCVAASNVGPGAHTSLGCRSVSVIPAGSPFGNFEDAHGVVGGIDVKGWAIDPDTTAPIYVWVTVDGVGRHLYANVTRSDVAAAYPGSGPNHGFNGTLTTTPGVHIVCVTASNVGTGAHRTLGCSEVQAGPWRVTATIDVGRGPFPMVSDPDGGTVYVGNQVDNTVSVIDTATNRVTDTIPVGRLPLALAVDSIAGEVYVTNGDDGTVSVIDTASGEVTHTIGVGGYPYGVAVDPVAREAYVGNDHMVMVIDTATHAVVTSIYVDAPNWLGALVVDPSTRRIFVVAGNGPSATGVAVLDAATRQIITTVPVGFWPEGLAFNDSRGEVYVTNYLDATMSIIDSTTLAVVDTVEVGVPPDSGLDPARVVVDPVAGAIYIVIEPEEGAGYASVTRIDAATREVTDSIRVDWPGGIAVDPGSGAVYLTTHTPAGSGVVVLEAS